LRTKTDDDRKEKREEIIPLIANNVESSEPLNKVDGVSFFNQRPIAHQPTDGQVDVVIGYCLSLWFQLERKKTLNTLIQT
jgi:hypothetical protein